MFETKVAINRQKNVFHFATDIQQIFSWKKFLAVTICVALKVWSQMRWHFDTALQVKNKFVNRSHFPAERNIHNTPEAITSQITRFSSRSFPWAMIFMSLKGPLYLLHNYLDLIGPFLPPLLGTAPINALPGDISLLAGGWWANGWAPHPLPSA